MFSNCLKADAPLGPQKIRAVLFLFLLSGIHMFVDRVRYLKNLFVLHYNTLLVPPEKLVPTAASVRNKNIATYLHI